MLIVINNWKREAMFSRTLGLVTAMRHPASKIGVVDDNTPGWIAPEAWDLLRAVYFLRDVKTGYKQDQSTLRHLIEHFPLADSLVTADIPVSDPADHYPGAPVYHAWTSARGYVQAVDVVRKMKLELGL